mgnify:FL=1
MRMKTARIILLALGIVFAVLGLLEILPFHIAQPAAMAALATAMLVQPRKGNRWFVPSLVLALFMYGTAVYTCLR